MQIVVYQSTTDKSAQSKKCNLLKRLRTEPSYLKIALVILANDKLLAKHCTADELKAAAAGLPSTRKRSNGLVVNVD
jgi:hypothetical protein